MSTPQEIAQDFAALCKAGQFDAAGERYWAEDVTSIEPMGDKAVTRGRTAVQGKAQWWYDNHTVHSAEVDGPYVNGDQFALRFHLDVTVKASGQRMQMTEIGLYTLRDGKVVEERFFYGMG